MSELGGMDSRLYTQWLRGGPAVLSPMGLRPNYRDGNPQRSWGGPSTEAWRTHSCVPRRDFSRRLLADATSKHKRRDESRRGTQECVRHVSRKPAFRRALF